MRPIETYQLIDLKGKPFLSLPDCGYIDESGRHKGMHFRKLGDILDVSHVDVLQFAHSAVKGWLADFEGKGYIKRITQEVSESKHDELTNALAAVQDDPDGKNRRGAVGNTILLEPGMQVAVGNGPMPVQPETLEDIEFRKKEQQKKSDIENKRIEDARKAQENADKQFKKEQAAKKKEDSNRKRADTIARKKEAKAQESMAGTPPKDSEPLPVDPLPSDAGMSSHAEGGASLKAAEAGGSWKDGMSFDEKRTTIKTSENVEFLNAVAKDSTEKQSLSASARRRLRMLAAV